VSRRAAVRFPRKMKRTSSLISSKLALLGGARASSSSAGRVLIWLRLALGALFAASCGSSSTGDTSGTLHGWPHPSEDGSRRCYARPNMLISLRRRLPWLLGLMGSWIVGCDRGSGEDPAAGTIAVASSKATSTPGVTPRQGKDGRVTVDGAPLPGDPKMDSTLVHEVWAEADGNTMVCLAGPNGDGARRDLGPRAHLVWTFEAGSHFEAMTRYYAWKGWGEYTTEYAQDREPYRAEWVRRQRAAAPEWKRFHAEQARSAAQR
jgi:hypothetical protein